MPDEVNNDQIVVQETDHNGEGNEPEEVISSQEPQEEALPDDSSERTRQQFEKLKENNRKLKEELDAAKGGKQTTSILDEYMSGNQFVPPAQMPQLPNLSQEKVKEITANLIDEQGYLNATELEKRLGRAEEAERRAQLAEERANKALERIGRFEIDSQKKQLHASYPELDPSSDSFSPDAYELVKNKLLDQLVKTGQQEPMKAAKEMEKFFRKQPLSQEKQAAISQRSQAMSVGQTGKASTLTTSEISELRKQSMTSDEAMDERIRRAGI